MISRLNGPAAFTLAVLLFWGNFRTGNDRKQSMARFQPSHRDSPRGIEPKVPATIGASEALARYSAIFLRSGASATCRISPFWSKPRTL